MVERGYEAAGIESGAGGMAAASVAACLGLSVLIVEAEPLSGGTAARSDGVAWMACNPHALADGDSLERAAAYFEGGCGNHPGAGSAPDSAPTSGSFAGIRLAAAQ